MDKVRKFKGIICFIAGILTGIVAGTTGLNVLVSYRLDTYYQKVRYLQAMVEDKSLQLEKLEESIIKRKFILKEVEVFLSFEGSELDKLELESHIKDKYRNLLGKEIKNLDIDIIQEVVDNRIMEVGGREYKLKVVKLLLSDVLKVWINTSPYH